MTLQGLEDAEKARPESNRVLLHVLKQAEVPTNDTRAGHAREHNEALYLAYPLIEGHADQTVTSFDYEAEYSGDGPVDWWADTRYLLCRSMREAQGKGLTELVRELETLRERASAQLVQAEDDYERRYVTPLRTARKREATQS